MWTFYAFFCIVFAVSLCASINMYLGATCWERADLSLGQVWHLIVSIPDLCILTYFGKLHMSQDMRFWY